MKSSFTLIILFFCFFLISSNKTIAQVDLQNGLIGYYKFNNNGADSSGFNNNANVQGDGYVEDRFGQPCNALHLNGDGQYVEFPKIITLEQPEWSYSIWFKLEQLPNNKDDAFLLSYKDVQYGDDIHLYVDNDDNNIKIFYEQDFGIKISSGEPVIVNTWYHVVLTYANGAKVKMYVNGSLKLDTVMAYTSPGPTLLISCNYTGSTVKGRVWGSVDDVRIYNRPVNSQEALALFQLLDNDTICTPEPIPIEPTLQVYVPDIFSPNNDGNNDILYVRGENIKELTFSVYDRWGDKVFESHDKEKGWNGKNKNEDCETGVYAYNVKITYTNGKHVAKNGNVTLVR